MLSIVVPAYNEGEHIYDNLAVIDKSVSRITPDYEIVAVNDGSKDNTGAEVARAAELSPGASTTAVATSWGSLMPTWISIPTCSKAT